MAAVTRETEEARLALYTSITPNAAQLAVQDMKFYAFIHYSVNTFTGREWGCGQESPAVFNPTSQDTDSWCAVIRDAGMKGVILTCKHHDGFCLWPTQTTEHCIRNSPYKNGKGDVVREVADSCKKYGLKFGVYLSPWDRNSAYYGTEKYNDFYIAQMTELLDGRYGDIFILWLDGACGAAKDGKPVQKYDFDRIWRTAKELQPGIAISGCGPDLRWVGNESGKCRESEWNVVPAFQCEYQNMAVNCQQDNDLRNFQKRCKDVMLPDMGSRDFLRQYDSFMWYPAEVDVSIHALWFNHFYSRLTLKSLRRLMRIYYDSVGGNCLLLLNVPPDKRGRIGYWEARRLRQMGKWLQKEDACVLPSAAAYENAGRTIHVRFDKCVVDRVRLGEDTTHSQRVERFSIYSGGQKLYSGTIIGFSKIAIFDPVETDELEIVIEESRFEPYVDKIEVCKKGAYRFDRK